MKLNDFFERAVCLNLFRRPDRWGHAFRLFNLLQWSVRSHYALDGKDWPGRAGASLDMHGPRLANSISIACLLREAMADKLHSLIIFEDDLLIVKDAAVKVPAYLEAVPEDWGLCYLGWNGRQEHPCERVSFWVDRIRRMNSLHAFGIRGHLMAEFSERLMRLDEPCDFAAKWFQERHSAYAPTENLVGQGGFGSDVNNPLDYLGAEVLENYL